MALTFDERLSRLAETEINIERIRVIERCFGNDNKDTLVKPGRALVGEGVLIKMCRKKPKPRYFFLFNDILLYGTIMMQKKKYVNPHVTSLDNIQIQAISDGDDPKLKNGWIIMSPKKSFCVYATTGKEKNEWMMHISNCIEKLSSSNRHAVEAAPQWIPDKDAGTCMRCRNAKFSVVNRRHHCRNCGYVVCGDCSKRKFLLPAQSDEPMRVCNVCYQTLSNGTAPNDHGVAPNVDKAKVTDEAAIISDYVQNKKGSKEDLAANTDSSDESENEEHNNKIIENDAQFYSEQK